MKKLIYMLVAVLILALCAPAFAAGGALENSEWLYEEDAQDDENWVEATDEDAFEEGEADEDEAIFESALQIYGWFEAHPLDVDTEKPSPDATKYQVLDERLNTMRALDAEVRAHFSDAISDKLLQSGVYEEIDGYLYTRADDRAIDQSIGEIELTVTDRTERKITYLLSVNHVDSDGNVTGSQALTYVRELIDGAWRFTQFPYFL